MSIRNQCQLLGISRSGYYYEGNTETEKNLEIMRRLDKLHLNGRRVPDISNTDQGVQFTSEAYIEAVESTGAQVSMDGRGQWISLNFSPRNRSNLIGEGDDAGKVGGSGLISVGPLGNRGCAMERDLE